MINRRQFKQLESREHLSHFQGTVSDDKSQGINSPAKQSGIAGAEVIAPEDAEERNQNRYYELKSLCSTLGSAGHDCRTEDTKNRGWEG